ncbi:MULTISPECIES: carboxypeptidase regulatory-like domain-containing protein [Myxococcaceae]|uniref:carboxypeptidase regulatory-like domain-containing protein n=1 Tax=Myxococcaceae TaxID=31 RepID=UPI00188F538C|nr:carboxypeptidase regulatory-like domain-containing protein [Simulacricoccus sp. 17bor-14]
MGSVLRLSAVLLGVLASLGASAVRAEEPALGAGLAWLASQQAADGSYGQSPGALATPVQSTCEVLRARLLLGERGAVGFNEALGYLDSHGDADTEVLARRIALDAQLGLPVPPAALQRLSQLRANQRPNGGFGARAGWDPSAFDTSVALDALSLAASAGDATAARAVGFQLGRQQSSGAWVSPGNPASVYVTALGMRSLVGYRDTSVGVKDALGRAQAFLLSARGPDGLWGEDYKSATVLLALLPFVSDLSLVEASAGALQARQLADGSWAEDPFTTALALQALKAYAARKAGPGPAASGSVSGYVVRAGSTEPVVGATVTVDQVPGVAVLTNGDGYYVVGGLPEGSYTVTAQKAGLSSASAVVSTRSGQVSVAPALVLQLLDGSGLVSGLVFDAETHQPLQAVQVSLAGATGYSVLTNAAGAFDFGPVAPGAYTLRFEKQGYLAMSGAVTVVAGQPLSAQLGLTRAGGAVDGSPGVVSGRVVDGKTGLALAGALFDLGGGLSGTSAADGTVRLASVPRGTYAGTLSAAGYQSVTFSLVFAPGASGDVGTLTLYPATATTPPTSLTLRGLVADGVSGAPVAGATVTLVETGASATTGADGRFALSGITLKSFQLALSAGGYVAATYGMQVAAYGEADVTLKLSPPGTGASSTQLVGQVTDAETGAPLAGAQVAVPGSSLSATTGADGHYALLGIDKLEFTLSISAVGYSQQQQGVRLSAHGQYTLDAALSPVPDDSFQVVTVAARQAEYPGGGTALFDVRVASLLNGAKLVGVLGEVQDVNGNPVATVRPYAPGTGVPVSQLGFDPHEVKELTVAWDTQQFSPGTYRLVMRVSEPGTTSRALPYGEVLAENAGSTRITSTLALGGALSIDPPLTQAGLPTPVNLGALVRNAGNTTLSPGRYVLTVKSAKTGAVLYTAEAQAEALPVGNSAAVAFGSWVPTENGNLPVAVSAKDPAVPGVLSGTLYVGDKASGTFTVSRTAVPEGNQTVRGTVRMQGVDTTVGTGTDPLFALVKEAVRRGGVYTGAQAIAWHDTNNNGAGCLGCHIETQSLLGLSSAQQKATIDPQSVQYLFNAVSTSLNADGSLRLSHPEFALTQAPLGLWSLSAWADVAATFRAKYRVAQYINGRKVRVGNQTRWDNDHGSAGWWATSPALTALTVKGFVDVVQNAGKLQPGEVPDYALGAAMSLGAGGTSEGVATGPDGMLYVVRTGGTITRMDPATGAVATVATGLGSIRGIAVAADGTLYVTRYGSASSIWKILPDGTRSTIAVSGNIPNANFGPDGWLYLPDWDGNRVVRVSPAGQVETYVSGGLLNRPYTVAFDQAGNLVVANYYAKELLRVDAASRSVSKLADGLGYEPTHMARAADGSIYYAAPAGRGLLRVRPDGTAERVIDSPNALYGLAAVGDRVYVVDNSTNAIREVVASPLDTLALGALRDEVTPAVRYLAANTESDNDNTVHAMRLIGLEEGRALVTDTALLAQLDAKVSAEAALLRARQKATGAWSRYNSNGGGDPLTTALVGIALEYTNPSPKDLQIRNAITYLLNAQTQDGSWDNYDNGLTTRLASTSFVMVFMPKALDRLGGIDIDLYVETPGNIQLANASVAPTTTPGAGGSATHLWKLPGVTGDGREVQFDLGLLGMQLGEERPAASRAYLVFKNSFVDEPVQLPLEVPVVRTTSGAALTVATDRPRYGAHETVQLAATVTNTSAAPSSGRVALSIVPRGGGEPLALLPALPFSGLAPGAQLPLLSAWESGAALAGDYQVDALVLDAAGRVLASASAPFSIDAPAQLAAASVASDKPVYEAWDRVGLLARVRNAAPNALLPASQATVTVQAPDGHTVFTGSAPVNQLLPGALEDLPFAFALQDAPEGNYRVTLQLDDAFTREPLASATAGFQVVRHPAASLSGSVSVRASSVYLGESNLCTDTAGTGAASGLSGVRLLHQVVQVDTGRVVDEASETVALTASAPLTRTHGVSTQGLSVGGYACLLLAELDGTRRTLGYAGFQVVEPPIRFTAALSQAGRGRLLVLVDNVGGGTADPNGPASAPDLVAQRRFLVELLTRAGWSFTLTDTADAFTRELRTGDYSEYALFHEREKLDTQLLRELREAVYRGEGLLVSGGHDSRDYIHDDALGICFTGRLEGIGAVDLAAPSFPLLYGRIPTLSGEKPIRFLLEGAEGLGTYFPATQYGAEPALSLNAFGRGQAAFSGADLLAIATRDGQASTAATVLRAMLEKVQPESLAAVGGAVVPVRLEVANQGIAVSVAASLALPAGLRVVDPGPGAVSGGVLGFSFPLAEGETHASTFWARLPTTPGPLLLAGQVTASQGGQSKVQPVSLALAVAAPQALQPVLAQLDALGKAARDDAWVFSNAATHVRNALKRTSPELAVKDALLATERLADTSSAEAVELRIAIDQWMRRAYSQP